MAAIKHEKNGRTGDVTLKLKRVGKEEGVQQMERGEEASWGEE